MKSLCLIAALSLTFASPVSAHDTGGTDVLFEGALPCTVVCSYWVENGFAPCENPFPPGSYVDHVTQPAPEPQGEKITILETGIYPRIDWDSFLCADREVRALLAQGANLHCPDPFVLLFGCEEHLALSVKAGETVIFRAYNWSDPFPAPGNYRYIFV